MSCSYGFYNPNEHNRPKLYCKITNEMCIYSKLCTKPNIDKYIFNDKVDECMIKKEEERKTIPNGAYFVRFIKKGYAYVEVDNRVIKVRYGGDDTNYLFIKSNSDGTCEGSVSPFVETTEKRKRKKKVTENGENN